MNDNHMSGNIILTITITQNASDISIQTFLAASAGNVSLFFHFSNAASISSYKLQQQYESHPFSKYPCISVNHKLIIKENTLIFPHKPTYPDLLYKLCNWFRPILAWWWFICGKLGFTVSSKQRFSFFPGKQTGPNCLRAKPNYGAKRLYFP